MKKGCLVFFVFLIATFLVCGSVADKDVDYKEIVKEVDRPKEMSVVLNNGDVQMESPQDDEGVDKEELKRELRSLGYLD